MIDQINVTARTIYIENEISVFVIFKYLGFLNFFRSVVFVFPIFRRNNKPLNDFFLRLHTN